MRWSGSKSMNCYPNTGAQKRRSALLYRINSTVFRLIAAREFVDRWQISVVLLNNEFFPQLIETNNGRMLLLRLLVVNSVISSFRRARGLSI
jgi:hypothetical protein